MSIDPNAVRAWFGRRHGYRSTLVPPRALRRQVVAAFDLAVIALSFAAAWRLHLRPGEPVSVAAPGFVAVAAAIQLSANATTGMYAGRWRQGSFEALTALAVAAVSGSLLIIVADAVTGGPMPVIVIVTGSLLATATMSGTRLFGRYVREQRMRPHDPPVHRVLVLGAGEAGAQIIRSMLRSGTAEYLPVGLVDDDPAKARLRIMGVPVVGTREALPGAVRRLEVDTVLLAIPSAGSGLVREVRATCQQLGVEMRVLPPVAELIDGFVGVHDIRELTYSDLLGRRELSVDLASVAGYLSGQTVLVTGAGGSIGSELCRQLVGHHPRRLVMLDRDESGLHGVQLSIHGRALLDTRDLVVADIRDRAWLDEVFATYRPDVVFHAAALKHLPLLELYPAEAGKTNVQGTLNVLEAARDHGVERFVNISTDKAADPISVLGYSKRIAERLTAAVAATAEGTFVSVRFGNVLGSRGSVLPVFRAQIEAGGPVTVTDPDVTRYFMTIEEAVQLVIQAAAIGRPGEALVLDMGEPVVIADVARNLMEFVGRTVDISFTGLRPGEKLHEALLGTGEIDSRPVHPLISHVNVPPIDPVQLLSLAAVENARMTAALRALATAPEVLDLRDRNVSAAAG